MGAFRIQKRAASGLQAVCFDGLMRNTMTLPFVDITPENGWFFTIVSQANRPAEKIFSAALQNIKHHKVCIELGHLGAAAVEGAVDKFLSKKPKPERFVCVAPLSKQYIVNTHRALQASFRNLSREMIKNAVNKRCGLLFGATLWGGRQVYDLIDIMRFVRAESEGQAVCIVGGRCWVPAILNLKPYF